MLQFLEEYAKHAALNFGQAMQGVRYFLSHPDIDRTAPRGTLRHAAASAACACGGWPMIFILR